MPDTWVRNCAELPSATMTSLIGASVGATSLLSGAKIKCHLKPKKEKKVRHAIIHASAKLFFGK